MAYLRYIEYRKQVAHFFEQNYSQFLNDGFTAAEHDQGKPLECVQSVSVAYLFMRVQVDTLCG